MTLFEECLIALKGKAIPLSVEESVKIEAILLSLFPFISANIDWEKIENKIILNSNEPAIIANLQKLLKTQLDELIYVIWDTNVPVLKTDLFSVVTHFDEVTRVSTRSWFLNLKQGYVIEWHWCGTKVAGLADEEKTHQVQLLKKILDELSYSKLISSEKPREIREALNRFTKTKYWKITNGQFVSSFQDIMPCIKNTLKESIPETIFLLFDDGSFPIVQTDLKKVIAAWYTILEIQQPFQIIDKNGSFLIDFNSAHGIIIKFNLGLKA
jgi:hypothetical protein